MFISFEGGEGSGKSTQIRKLKDSLFHFNKDVMTVREPGGTELGERIRHYLLATESGQEPLCPSAELFLFLAARKQQLEERVLPAISRGTIVLSDRFNDSSVAYQGGGRQMGVEKVHQLCELAFNGFRPDLTFYLDLDPEVGMQRLKGSLDRMEKESSEFHKRVRDTYLEITKNNPDRVSLIDAGQSKEAVFSEIFRIVKAFLKL